MQTPNREGARTDPDTRRVKVQLAISPTEPVKVVIPPVAAPEVPSAIVQSLMLK